MNEIEVSHKAGWIWLDVEPSTPIECEHLDLSSRCREWVNVTHLLFLRTDKNQYETTLTLDTGEKITPENLDCPAILRILEYLRAYSEGVARSLDV